MKNIAPLLVLSCIWLIGCGDDDSSDSFIGIWVADNITVSNCSDVSRNSSDAVSCDAVSCYRITFGGDGVHSFQRGLATETGTWSVGDVLNLCLDEEGEITCESFLAQFSDASLILTSDSTSSGCITAYLFNKQEEVVETN